MSDNTHPLVKLANLGPKSAQMLKKIGIQSVEQFLTSDPFLLYANLKQAGIPTSLNILYAIIGAQQNCPWQQVAREQKTEIIFRLEEMGLAPK